MRPKKRETTKPTKLNFFNFLRKRIWFTPSPGQAFSFTSVDVFLFSFAIVVSFITHFLYIGYPNSCVFDEVHFGNFTNSYVTSTYFFDIHPPLGKLLLYLGGSIFGYDGKTDFSTIGSSFISPHKLRFFPCLFGSFLSPLLYLTLKYLDISSLWCFSISLLPSLDNAFIVESRFVLIDSFLVFFAACSLLFMAIFTHGTKHPLILAVYAGFAVGATVSVKFTGSGVAMSLIACYFMNYNFFEAMILSLISSISGFLIFFMFFFIHFIILKPHGPGCLFHHDFCSNKRKGLLGNTFELIRIMLERNFAIQDTHSYSSKWYTWPFMTGKGTYMWVENDKHLWCVGNPVVWYSSLLGIILFLFFVIRYSILRKYGWILLGYVISYFPFANVHRVMYNYHYFIPILFTFLGLALVFEKIWPESTNVSTFWVWLSSVGYIIYFPITYGISMKNSYFKLVMFKWWTY